MEKLKHRILAAILWTGGLSICFMGQAFAEGNKGGGVIGTAVDLIGEALALPFEFIAGAFRFIF